MDDILHQIISKIAVLNPLHGKKLKKLISNNSDTEYFNKANLFLDKYTDYLKSQNKDIDYGINCYLKFTATITYEQIRFFETGEYSSKSFDDVNKNVYSNPEIMEYYMIGLLLTQVLWKQHYNMYSFFVDSFPKYNDNVSSYLEVGGGHGLFISEAINIMNNDNVDYHLIDVSKTSIEISKSFLNNDNINYIIGDMLEFDPEIKFDFITMGEVLEHVEQPLELLLKLKSILNENGRIFITTPTNAPAMDHIYLFRNDDEIRNLIGSAGLNIIEEKMVYTENVSKEKIEELKITGMYGAFLTNSN